MSHYGKYDDDRKRNKTRNDIRHSSSSSSDHKYSSHHHNQQQQRSSNGKHRGDDDDYYSSSSMSSNKRNLSSRSRSRSRSSLDRNSLSSSHQKIQRTSINNNNNNNNNKYEDPTAAASVVASTTPVSFSNNMISRAFNPGAPSRTIMLRQLPLQMEDQELRNELAAMCITVKDVRLVRNRETGQSRGFAFIEFNAVEEAQSWMNATLGWIIFSNYNNKVQMFYSHSGDENNSRSDKMSSVTDWDCAKCGIKNFKRRDKCFKCSITREESERRSGGDGYDHVGANPCNTILLRGLDALTNEETVIEVLNKFTNSCIPIKNCHIARDVLTNVSCGFAFIELNSIQDSTNLLQILQPNFEVDGKQVTSVYSKNSYKTALTQLEISSRLSYQPLVQDNNHNSYHQVNNKINQADQANSAASIAQAALANMHKKQELSSYLTTHMKNHKMLGSDAGTDSLSSSSSSVNTNQLQVYPPPDMSTFTYDETSGYYYDYSTGFYYDASSQYYFNPLKQQYMYWEPIKSTYIPVTNNLASTTDAVADTSAVANAENCISATETVVVDTTNTNVIVEEKKPSKPVTKTAAQIAKDMERWAQSQNKKKETFIKKPITTVTVNTPITNSVKSVAETTNLKLTAITTVMDEGNRKPDEPTIPTSITTTSTTTNEDIKKTALNENEKQQQQNAVREDSETEHKKAESETPVTVAPFNEASLIDISKLACLLCKRRFDSLDILNKHIVKSDLHKKNLENYKKEHLNEEPEQETQKKNNQSESDSLLAALQYRDRAKERRDKYGIPEPPSPKYSSSSSSSSSSYKSKPKDINEEVSSLATNNSIIEKNTESVASKLMKKMGWNEGSGIGKNLQGISAPIEASIRQKGAGLGATSYEMDPNDSYKDGARKSARARFESLN